MRLEETQALQDEEAGGTGAWVLSHSVVSNSLRPHELWPAILCLWDSPGKNSGVGCHFLLQGIFLTQGSNPGLFHLLHGQADSLPLNHLGSPRGTGLTIKEKWERDEKGRREIQRPWCPGSQQQRHFTQGCYYQTVWHEAGTLAIKLNTMGVTGNCILCITWYILYIIYSILNISLEGRKIDLIANE